MSDDTTTTLSATATDAAGNDSALLEPRSPTSRTRPRPAAPTITDTDPDSPANDNNPEVKGTAGAGSPTGRALHERRLHRVPAATGSAAPFAGAGITVAVAGRHDDDARARRRPTPPATTSGCSAAFTYVEDSTPPRPEITGTDPGSPANDNDPAVRGTAVADSTVRLFESDDCSGPVAAEGSAAQFAGPGLTASVPDDSTTSFTAVALDGANESACSGSFSYREDSTAPETVILGGPPAKVKMPAARRVNRVKRQRERR